MATAHEECTDEEQRAVVRFVCGQKDSVQTILKKNVSCLMWEVSVA
jgi:hypothetical protein